MVRGDVHQQLLGSLAQGGTQLLKVFCSRRRVILCCRAVLAALDVNDHLLYQVICHFCVQSEGAGFSASTSGRASPAVAAHTLVAVGDKGREQMEEAGATPAE